MNAEDAIFGTPLVAAARGGHTEVVAALLRKDEVWPDQHSQRDTPLTAAVNGGHLECARLLLDYRNKDIAQKLVATPQQSHDENCAHGHRMPSDDALTLASKRGDVELVKLLLARGADATGGREGTCDTPLTAAAANGHAACLKEILAAGANVDGVARWAGRTALVAAAESDSSDALECCEILLQGGADPNFVSTGVVGRRLGYGAVHAAAARMDSAMVKMLVAHGADPNRRAKNTDTKEVKSRRAAAAQALWGPEVAGQRLDNTPLHLAVAAYINEAAKRRVAESARRRADGVESDDGAGDSDGDAADSSDSNKNQFDTPAERRRRRKLHARAMDQGEPGTGEVAAMEVIKSLLECGADHGAFVVDSTPMHMAALGGALDVVDLLVKHGADVNACAPNGCTTPIEAAARYAADIVVDFAEERDEPPKPALGRGRLQESLQNLENFAGVRRLRENHRTQSRHSNQNRRRRGPVHGRGRGRAEGVQGRRRGDGGAPRRGGTAEGGEAPRRRGRRNHRRRGGRRVQGRRRGLRRHCTAGTGRAR